MPRGRSYNGLSYKDPDWYRRRHRQLQKFPWCRYCQELGYRVKAVTADHIKPHRGNKALFDDDNNLQSLCKLHANSTKQVEEIIGEAVGCDLLGNPRGEKHPWNGGEVDKPRHTSQSIGRMLRQVKERNAREDSS